MSGQRGQGTKGRGEGENRGLTGLRGECGGFKDGAFTHSGLLPVGANDLGVDADMCGIGPSPTRYAMSIAKPCEQTSAVHGMANTS